MIYIYIYIYIQIYIICVRNVYIYIYICVCVLNYCISSVLGMIGWRITDILLGLVKPTNQHRGDMIQTKSALCKFVNYFREKLVIWNMQEEHKSCILIYIESSAFSETIQTLMIFTTFGTSQTNQTPSGTLSNTLYAPLTYWCASQV